MTPYVHNTDCYCEQIHSHVPKEFICAKTTYGEGHLTRVRPLLHMPQQNVPTPQRKGYLARVRPLLPVPIHVCILLLLWADTFTSTKGIYLCWNNLCRRVPRTCTPLVASADAPATTAQGWHSMHAVHVHLLSQRLHSNHTRGARQHRQSPTSSIKKNKE